MLRTTHLDLAPYVPDVSSSFHHLCIFEAEHARARALYYPVSERETGLRVNGGCTGKGTIGGRGKEEGTYFTLSSSASKSASRAARVAFSYVRNHSNSSSKSGV